MLAIRSRLSPWRRSGPIAVACLLSVLAVGAPAAGSEHLDQVASVAIWPDTDGAQRQSPPADLVADAAAQQHAARQPAVAEGTEGSGSDHDDADTGHDIGTRSATLDRRRHGISQALAKLPAGADPFLARGPPRV